MKKVNYSKKNEELIILVKQGNEKAFEEILELNERLCMHIANKFNPKDQFQLEDYASVAKIGLIKALNTFKLEKGVKFATYAVRVMTNEILMEIRRDKKLAFSVPLETPLNIDWDGNELTFMDVIPSPNDFFDEFLEEELMKEKKQDIMEFGEQLKDTEKKLFDIIIRNPDFKQREASKELGLSQSYMSRIHKRIRIKFRKFYNKKYNVKGGNEMTKQLASPKYERKTKTREQKIFDNVQKEKAEKKKVAPPRIDPRELPPKEKQLVFKDEHHFDIGISKEEFFNKMTNLMQTMDVLDIESLDFELTVRMRHKI